MELTQLAVMLGVLAVPFAAAIIAGIVRPRAVAAVSVVGSLATAVLGVWLIVLAYPEGLSLTFGGLPWLPGEDGRGFFGLTIDPLGSIMVFVITVIGFLVVLYSTEYLSPRHREHPSHGGRNRYFFWLLFFLGSMVGVALSPNLLQLFIFWEMTTISSWALISHDHTEAAQRAGMKALVLTHVGGIGFLVALCLLFVYTGSFDFPAVSRVAGGSGALLVLLLLVAAWAKSAQLPFHTWLPDAMEAPTPISAYLHAAAMVKAGVYLVARLIISNSQLPAFMGLLVAGMAMLTMLMAIMNYFRQDDLKRLLAYSTIAHLGYVLVGCSLALFPIASTMGLQGGILHILCHGVAKGTLFLCVGAISYGAGTRRISELGGLGRKMPLVATAFLVGAIAVTGIPPFSTFWSKFLIFSGTLQVPGGAIILVLLTAESVVSFAWFLWVTQRVFFGVPTPAAAAAADPPPAMATVLIVGIVLCVVAPIIGFPLVKLIVP